MKKSLPLSLLALALALPALQGCLPTAIATGAAVSVMSLHDRRTTGTQADDETTEWRAKALVPEQYKSHSRLNVTSYNHRLLLTGEVPNEAAKTEIEALVRKLDGVRDVHNELGVGPVSPLSSRSNDAFIDSKVKARLVDSQQVSANHVKVVTERGITYLMGMVSDREARVAISIARTTAGVRKVVNIMEILPESTIRHLDSRTIGTGTTNANTQSAPVENR